MDVKDATETTTAATAEPTAIAPEAPADQLGDLVDTWVRDTFHGSRIGRELSDESHNRILAARDTLKERLRALLVARA